SVANLLQAERLLLNTAQRMSGIATLTHEYQSLLKGYSTTLLDTRKTTPNFRLLEKEAVRIGGGANHRMGLYDMILLKDNHIDCCGGIAAAIQRARYYVTHYHPSLKIEIETRNEEEMREVVAVGGVDRILLDNFSPRQVEQVLPIIGDRYETEVSGGIHKGNIIDYAKTGVNFISVGSLIHQARSLDMSFKITPAGESSR
ncbi:MAG: carboxylating nicotinate-nucleotide diphosphorylase, partial [Chitinophagaceae bacterium]